MSRTRFCLTAIIFAAVISSGAAIAQSPPAPAAGKTGPVTAAADSSKTSKIMQVETWTAKQWEAAKKTWAKDKTKWADCQKQSNTQKLEGRKSWSFAYTCMTS